jgi:proteasome lid subunit RPN8/RPN11
MTTFLPDLIQHAADDYPKEACGLVVQRKNKVRLIRARNIAADPNFTFDLDPEAWLDVQEDEAVIGIYHSHPSGIAEPSLADLSGCEASALPWHIVGHGTGAYTYVQPSGFRAPYTKRPYVFGVHDCYALVRDWYDWEWKIKLENFRRTDRFWERGDDLFRDNFRKAGFTELKDQDQIPVLAGDLFLLQVHADLPNHIVLYEGKGIILHHAQERLSERVQWGGYWQKHAVNHLRHNSKLGMTHG